MKGPTDRAAGILLGLAAGDRNGGPVRMALRVAESLLDRSAFDPSDIGARYLQWHQEGAFDTGPIAERVLELVASGLTFEKASLQVDEETGGKTAGCNPAHRSAPLAMLVTLKDEELARAAREEAALTHRSPLAGDAAAAVAVLCRHLLRGAAWSTALAAAAEGRGDEVQAARGAGERAGLRPTGFAPDALAAAVHFVGGSGSFVEALDASLGFAGPANYCPVLVGSIGGARWGASRIPADALDHHAPDFRGRVRAAAAVLASGWQGS